MKTEQRLEIINQKGYKCECCGLTEWLGQPIKLEIHHIDGNHNNNQLDNLQVLCPNCHSFTENHSKNKRGKKPLTDEEFVEYLQNAPTVHQALKMADMSTAGVNYERARQLIVKYNITHLFKQQEQEEKPQNYCADCGIPIMPQSKYCIKCLGLHHRKAERPTAEVLAQELRESNFVQVGKKYGVTDNAIRKWCKDYGMSTHSQDYK